MTKNKTFRTRLRGKEPMIGTWVKTPSPIICEVLGATSLDVLCLDAEHAPFGRPELDSCLHACRAADMPSLVRTPSKDPHQILNALDCGATGILVPHVCSPEEAREIARHSRFGAGGRGYAGSTRFAGFTTTPMPENRARSKEETTVIAQLEDKEALDNLDGLMAVEGIDCYFIGRIDLTIALGANSPDDALVVDAVHAICDAGKKVGKPIGMFTANQDEIPGWRDAGASLFLLSSDQGFILSGARKLRETFDSKLG